MPFLTYKKTLKDAVLWRNNRHKNLKILKYIAHFSFEQKKIHVQNRFFQVNTSNVLSILNYAFSAVFNLHNICTLLHRSKLNIFAKNRLTKNHKIISWNFSKTIANVAKFAKFCQISKISAWESGRFWKMLQNAYFLAKIGADTAENEQHFAEILPTDALWRLCRRPRVWMPAQPLSQRFTARFRRVMAMYPSTTWAENKESSRCTNIKYHRNIKSFRNIDISEIYRN